MGIFSRKKKTSEPKTALVPQAASASLSASVDGALLRPRITEKASVLSSANVYTFDIVPSANAKEVREAVKNAYGVVPVKVSILPVRSKKMFSKGRRGRTASGKKAYVFLKKGDTIQFV